MGHPDGTDSAGPTTDPEWYEVSTDCTAAELTSVARAYARAVVAAHDLAVDVGDLAWEISKRAKRRAGAVRHVDGDPEAIRLTWEHFQRRGWRETAATIRHELVHVHLLNTDGDPAHGEAFRQLAAELDAPLRCARFAEPKWWVVCESCGSRLARYRRSKLVEQPERYRCGECGGRLRVEGSRGDAL